MGKIQAFAEFVEDLTFMDYEKEDLDHSLIPIYCDACGRHSEVFACDLKANPQTICSQLADVSTKSKLKKEMKATRLLRKS